MGHYYSEMVSAEERDAEQRRRQERIECTRLEILDAITERGIEYVLADIITEAAERGIYIGNKYRRY